MTTAGDIAVTGPQVEECRRTPEAGTGKGWSLPESLWRLCCPTGTWVSGHLILLTAGTVASSQFVTQL